ncbi:MAG: hypothetical protein NTU89_02380 [Candidatus Dependentiae bacterium]|nr:hypothetical protein [Candidatus Dependentiae bacterium]
MTNKILLFSAISFFAFTHAEESTTFVPRTYTVEFQVQPKNASDLEEFNNLSQNILNTVQKSDKGLLFQTFLSLLQDIQLAVFSNQSTLQIATDVMESLIDSQLIQDALAQATQPEAISQSTEALDENPDQTSEEIEQTDEVSPVEAPEQIASEEISDEEMTDENSSENEELSASQEANAQSDDIDDTSAQAVDSLSEIEEYIPSFVLSLSIVASKEEDMDIFQEAKEALLSLAQGSVEVSDEVKDFINKNGRGMLSLRSANDQEEA